MINAGLAPFALSFFGGSFEKESFVFFDALKSRNSVNDGDLFGNSVL
jgi:hypothetical protein